MIPNVVINKKDGNTGVVRPSAVGVLAIIAAAAQGPMTPGSFTRQSDMVTTYGGGKLPDYAAYVTSVTGKPVVLLRCATSTAATYGTITETGAGTSAITAGGTAPIDDYSVVITWIAGGTIAAAGITYTYTLDGGEIVSAVQALGTANTLTIPNSGVSIALGAGTILAGQTTTFTTTGPQSTTSDINAALEALRTTRLSWESLLLDVGPATATTVTTVDTWLLALEGAGVYKDAYLNSRLKNAGESEATYQTAMATAFSASSSINLYVGTDGGFVVSPLTGLTQVRPTSLGMAARAMSVPIGVDLARVSDGPIPNFSIDDQNGNPVRHDEALYPGLDDLRLSPLRSFEEDENGAYINNANVLSPPGSDYVYVQQNRCMNAFLTAVRASLVRQLSQSARKDPATGFILEKDAARIEGLANTAGAKAVKGQVSGSQVTLSRDDDVSSNAGAIITATAALSSLIVIKGFAVTAVYVKNISVSV